MMVLSDKIRHFVTSLWDLGNVSQFSDVKQIMKVILNKLNIIFIPYPKKSDGLASRKFTAFISGNM